MNGDELRAGAEDLTSAKTRWLVIITGCISGLAGSLSFGPLFSMLPALLISGAVLQRWSPRPGRWLMWFGAFWLTVDVGVFLGPPVLRRPRSLDGNVLVLLALCLLSLVLVGWCDVALIIDSRRSKNASASANREFPRAADWIVGAVALCLTGYAVWPIHAIFDPVRRHGDWEIALLFVVSVAAFDTALARHAVKTFRARRRA